MRGSGHISCLININSANAKVAEKNRPIRDGHLNVQKPGFTGPLLPKNTPLNRQTGSAEKRSSQRTLLKKKPCTTMAGERNIRNSFPSWKSGHARCDRTHSPKVPTKIAFVLNSVFLQQLFLGIADPSSRGSQRPRTSTFQQPRGG